MFSPILTLSPGGPHLFSLISTYFVSQEGSVDGTPKFCNLKFMFLQKGSGGFDLLAVAVKRFGRFQFRVPVQFERHPEVAALKRPFLSKSGLPSRPENPWISDLCSAAKAQTLHQANQVQVNIIIGSTVSLLLVASMSGNRPDNFATLSERQKG